MGCLLCLIRNLLNDMKTVDSLDMFSKEMDDTRFSLTLSPWFQYGDRLKGDKEWELEGQLRDSVMRMKSHSVLD